MDDPADLTRLEKIIHRFGDENEEEAIAALRAFRAGLQKEGVVAHQLLLGLAIEEQHAASRSAEEAIRAWQRLQQATKPIAMKSLERTVVKLQDRAAKLLNVNKALRKENCNLMRRLRRSQKKEKKNSKAETVGESPDSTEHSDLRAAI